MIRLNINFSVRLYVDCAKYAGKSWVQIPNIHHQVYGFLIRVKKLYF